MIKSISTTQDSLRLAIYQGRFRAGERLPSERALATQFAVPQSQIHNALQSLVAESMLECRRGSGYYVNAPAAAPVSQRAALLMPSDFCGQPDSPFNHLLVHAPGCGIELLPRIVATAEFDAALTSGLKEPGLDGILVAPFPGQEWSPAFNLALAQHFPLVFIHRAVQPGVFSAVESNHFEAGFRAALELAERGYRRLGYLGYDSAVHPHVTGERWRGFQEGCRFKNLPQPQARFAASPNSLGLDEEFFVETTGAEAVFCASAAFTTRAAEWLAAHPAQLARVGLLGMDLDLPPAGYPGRIACLVQDRQAEARLTMELMKELIAARGRAANRQLLIPPFFLAGDSLRSSSSV